MALKDISNPRLFRLKKQRLQYKFMVRYLPGKHNTAADFLLRYPRARADPDEVDEDQDAVTAAAMPTGSVTSPDPSEHATLDEELIKQMAV